MTDRDLQFPENWNDQDYLASNPDVELAVRLGRFTSGYAHYLEYGRFEDRPGGWVVVESGLLTRECVDPWRSIEIGVAGDIRPCCIHPPLGSLAGVVEENSLRSVRNWPSFKELRQGLLKGALPKCCRSCHIRGMIPVEKLQDRVRRLIPRDEALDAPAPLKEMRLDITTKCNLRCIYCATSQPGYVGAHMSDAVFGNAMLLIEQSDTPVEIFMNGHGETTIHPAWTKFASAILDKGARVNILSNFAKKFSKEEIEIFARIETIQISLDTMDEELLSAVRRHVSLGTILRNIHAIRARAKQQGRRIIWSISCGVYDANIDYLEDVAWFVIEAGFYSITFWNLVSYPQLENQDVKRVNPISTLADQQRSKAFDTVKSVVNLLKDRGVVVLVAGNFLDDH